MTKSQKLTRTRLWSAHFSQIYPSGPQCSSRATERRSRLDLDSHEHESPEMVSPHWP